MNRREFLTLGGASLLVMSSPFSTLASTSSKAKGKFIWVVLRGGLDSLHTLVPSFDRDLHGHRPNLLKTIAKDLLPLSQGYSLHPSLAQLHTLFQQQELLPIVAVSTGYKRRSHFDAQDFMEAGTGSLDLNSGWLARATTVAGSTGVAIAKTVPLSMRGGNNISTWYPSKLKTKEQDIYGSVLGMYEYEPNLAQNLMAGLEQRKTAGINNKSKGKFVELAQACGNLMSSDKNLDSAVLELNGWDTHNRQHPRLKNKLSELDQGIAALKQHLGEQWNNSLVAISTEFGRTVKENGTNGTDHGTASALFLTGGAVKGGKVLGQWPGLNDNQLHEGRDLKPTSNMFDWLATSLQQHWLLSPSQSQLIFPNSQLLQQQLVRTT